jgi:hypothetical protein
LRFQKENEDLENLVERDSYNNEMTLLNKIESQYIFKKSKIGGDLAI